MPHSMTILAINTIISLQSLQNKLKQQHQMFERAPNSLALQLVYLHVDVLWPYFATCYLGKEMGSVKQVPRPYRGRSGMSSWILTNHR